jgi:hypothetical protein
MQHSIDVFIPSKPDTMGWYGLTTRLILYTDEMFGYGWIANEETKDFYVRRLQEIINSIGQTSEKNSACSIINESIVPQVEQDLQKVLITTEGYKFLHYYTMYIKEEIVEEFGPCP